MKRANRDLAPLPSKEQVIAAVRELEQEKRWWYGVPAHAVATRLKVEPAKRAGHGARGPHSWSGWMSPALRIAPRLRSLANEGLLENVRSGDYRNVYMTTAGCRERLGG